MVIELVMIGMMAKPEMVKIIVEAMKSGELGCK
jgi:hypothetical protein